MENIAEPAVKPAPKTESPGVAARLVDAATGEFVRHGFAGASIARIVDLAQCNVRMIYHYYGSKDGLYRACLSETYDRLREAEARASFWQDAPPAAVASLVGFTFDYMQKNPEFQGLMRIENMNGGLHIQEILTVNSSGGQLMDRIGDLLDRGRARGDFVRRPEAGDLYLSILGLATIHLVNQHTMGMVLGRDLARPDWLATRRNTVIGIILAWLATPEAA